MSGVSLGPHLSRAVLDVQLHLGGHLPQQLEAADQCVWACSWCHDLVRNGWILHGQLYDHQRVARDYLWSEASQVIQSYGSSGAAYGLLFLGAHFIWPSA